MDINWLFFVLGVLILCLGTFLISPTLKISYKSLIGISLFLLAGILLGGSICN